jgi:hypothetical protein
MLFKEKMKGGSVLDISKKIVIVNIARFDDCTYLYLFMLLAFVPKSNNQGTSFSYYKFNFYVMLPSHFCVYL